LFNNTHANDSTNDADDLDIDIDLLDIQNCLEDNNPIPETNEDNLKEITTPFS
jgi:hypothetical protein